MKLPPKLHLVIANQLHFLDNMDLCMVDRYFYKLIKLLSHEEVTEIRKITMLAHMTALEVCFYKVSTQGS